MEFKAKATAAAAEATCSAPGCEIMAVHQCSACGAAKYCSKECQKVHWKAGHKAECATLASTAKKTGEAKAGVPSVVHLRSGNVYEGDIGRDGKPLGRGFMKFTGGDTFDGVWEDGMAREGTYTFSCGDVYIGGFLNNKMNGRGQKFFADGSYYDGDFKDNMMSGRGTMHFPDKAIYQGDWKNDGMHGEGRIVYDNQDVYEGEFKFNKEHGMGTLYKKTNGREYKGFFKDGTFDGQVMMEIDPEVGIASQFLALRREHNIA